MNFTAIDQIRNPEVLLFIRQTAELSEPDNIMICNRSESEYGLLCNQLVEAGTFKKLNPEQWPNSYACNSDPSDVARIEDRTFICSRTKADAGPTNYWVDPREMRSRMKSLFRGFFFRVHRKVHSFLDSLKSSHLTYQCYKISENTGEVKGLFKI